MTVTIQNTTDAKNVQYKNEFKRSHVGNKVVMFRLGNTYKVYDEDAEVLNKVLNTTIENNSVEFSYNMLDIYLPRLIRFGYSIVIVEQQ